MRCQALGIWALSQIAAGHAQVLGEGFRGHLPGGSPAPIKPLVGPVDIVKADCYLRAR